MPISSRIAGFHWPTPIMAQDSSVMATQRLAPAPHTSNDPYSIIMNSTDQMQSSNRFRPFPPIRRLEPAQMKQENKQPASTSSTTPAQTSSRRDYVAWSKRETEALVRWLDTHDNFNAMKRNTARMLPMLADHLQHQITGCTKTAKQCDHKIRNLKKCYKKVKTKLNTTGDNFETANQDLKEEILDQFPYFVEFDRIMTDEHIVRHIPKALLKLAADGGHIKSPSPNISTPSSHTTVKWPESSNSRRDEIGENDRRPSGSLSPVQISPSDDGKSSKYSPATSATTTTEEEFPDMSRFRSIRPKDDQSPAGQCPVAHNKLMSNTSNMKMDNSMVEFLTPGQLQTNNFGTHPRPELLSDDMPDLKKQRFSGNGLPVSNANPFMNLFPHSSLNSLGSKNGLFSGINPQAMSKCPLKMEDFDLGSKCPVGMDSSSVGLFAAAGGNFGSLASSLSQITNKSTLSSTSSNGETIPGTNNISSGHVEENNPHGTLLNILKMMTKKPQDAENGPNPDGQNEEDESTPQETAQILAEHIKSSLAKKESVNRQKLYLNHLQQQIQRHTCRAEMLYNNGQVDRASKIMDKIDELEMELHEVLSRPLSQF